MQMTEFKLRFIIYTCMVSSDPQKPKPLIKGPYILTINFEVDRAFILWILGL